MYENKEEKKMVNELVNSEDLVLFYTLCVLAYLGT